MSINIAHLLARAARIHPQRPALVRGEQLLASYAELDALCLANIARFKRPKRYVVVDALPKNTTGKVLKTLLRERLGSS